MNISQVSSFSLKDFGSLDWLPHQHGRMLV